MKRLVLRLLIGKCLLHFELWHRSVQRVFLSQRAICVWSLGSLLIGYQVLKITRQLFHASPVAASNSGVKIRVVMFSHSRIIRTFYEIRDVGVLFFVYYFIQNFGRFILLLVQQVLIPLFLVLYSAQSRLKNRYLLLECWWWTCRTCHYLKY